MGLEGTDHAEPCHMNHFISGLVIKTNCFMKNKLFMIQLLLLHLVELSKVFLKTRLTRGADSPLNSAVFTVC